MTITSASANMLFELFPPSVYVSDICLINGLPREILIKILGYLDNTTLFISSITCQDWNQLCTLDPRLSKKLQSAKRNLKQQVKRNTIDTHLGVTTVERKYKPTGTFSFNGANLKSVKINTNLLRVINDNLRVSYKKSKRSKFSRNTLQIRM